jgi:hypothetical protein
MEDNTLGGRNGIQREVVLANVAGSKPFVRTDGTRAGEDLEKIKRNRP